MNIFSNIFSVSLILISISTSLFFTTGCSNSSDIVASKNSAAPKFPTAKNDDENRFNFPGAEGLSALTTQADYVVEGVVGRIWSRYETDAQNNRLIFSYVTVNLTHQHKGEPLPVVITVKNPGGEVGRNQMILTHTPQFWQEGQEALLFLNKRDGFLWLQMGEKSKVVISEDRAKFFDQSVTVTDLRALVSQGAAQEGS